MLPPPQMTHFEKCCGFPSVLEAVHLYSCILASAPSIAGVRRPESQRAGEMSSQLVAPLITTCPHSSYSIFQTSPLISCTFACCCPSDWRSPEVVDPGGDSPPGSLRIKEGGVLQISKSGSSRLFWPSNKFSS